MTIQPAAVRASLLCLLALPAAQAAVPDARIADLVARAAVDGEIRVMVQVAAPQVPEGLLTAAEAGRQRAAIAARQRGVAAQVSGSGAHELHRFRHIPFSLYRADANGLRALGHAPWVVGLNEDVPEPPALADSAAIIGAPAAWSQGADGTGKVVAVLDTGVDLAHPFFSSPGKIVAEGCFSSNVNETTLSLCPDGEETSFQPGAGDACPPDVAGCDHGTHVAGIAVGNDGVGPDYGIARGAGLITIQVYTLFVCQLGCNTYSGSASSYPSDQTRALEQLYEWRDTYPIAAVNMSVGGGSFSDQAACDEANTARKAAIDNLRSVGIPAIIASGNFSQRNAMTQPGCISSAISVGATNDDDTVASFSNIAPFIGLLAPGVGINSSVPGGGTAELSGTSMATPHVAGAWAILRQGAPGASLDELFAALRATGTLVDDQRSNGSVTGMARINVDQALAALLSTEPEFDSVPAAGALVDFGTVGTGMTSAEAVVAVSNPGGAELTLACALEGADAARFAVTRCPASVASLGNDEVRLTCAPQAAGPLSASLVLTTNDADEGSVSFDLGCEGIVDMMFSDGFENAPQ